MQLYLNTGTKILQVDPEKKEKIYYKIKRERESDMIGGVKEDEEN